MNSKRCLSDLETSLANLHPFLDRSWPWKERTLTRSWRTTRLLVTSFKKELIGKEIIQLAAIVGSTDGQLSAKEGPGRLLIRSLKFPLRFPGKWASVSPQTVLTKPSYSFPLIAVRNCALFSPFPTSRRWSRHPCCARALVTHSSSPSAHTFEGLQANF